MKFQDAVKLFFEVTEIDQELYRFILVKVNGNLEIYAIAIDTNIRARFIIPDDANYLCICAWKSTQKTHMVHFSASLLFNNVGLGSFQITDEDTESTVTDKLHQLFPKDPDFVERANKKYPSYRVTSREFQRVLRLLEKVIEDLDKVKKHVAENT